MDSRFSANGQAGALGDVIGNTLQPGPPGSWACSRGEPRGPGARGRLQPGAGPGAPGHAWEHVPGLQTSPSCTRSPRHPQGHSLPPWPPFAPMAGLQQGPSGRLCPGALPPVDGRARRRGGGQGRRPVPGREPVHLEPDARLAAVSRAQWSRPQPCPSSVPTPDINAVPSLSTPGQRPVGTRAVPPSEPRCQQPSPNTGHPLPPLNTRASEWERRALTVGQHRARGRLSTPLDSRAHKATHTHPL